MSKVNTYCAIHRTNRESTAIYITLSFFYSFQIDQMIEKVSYPNFILNSTILDEFYQEVSTR